MKADPAVLQSFIDTVSDFKWPRNQSLAGYPAKMPLYKKDGTCTDNGARVPFR